MKWVTDTRLAELTGLTRKAIEARRARAIWVAGLHFRKASDGRYWYNTEQIDEWVETSVATKASLELAEKRRACLRELRQIKQAH